MLLRTIAKSDYSMSDNMDDPNERWQIAIKSNNSFLLKLIRKHLI